MLGEEPLEIRVDGQSVATTMRTPGDDWELAIGFCWSEGWISRPPARVRYCATASALESRYNVVTIDRDAADRSDPARTPAPRLGTIGSSCGICGTEQIQSLVDRLPPMTHPPVGRGALAAVLSGLDSSIRARQELFGSTGGSHAAAAFSAETGDVAMVREDIGRHNAVDKVIGRLALDRDLPTDAHPLGLWVSGRASFEMVQKAWAGGFALLVTVSAASALAIRTAERARLPLVSFAREGTFTLHSGSSTDHHDR